MSTQKRKAPKSAFFKFESYGRLWPAIITADRRAAAVRVMIQAARRMGSVGSHADIHLTPHEAQAFAAWLSDQAEHLLAKQARAAERAEARAAARRARATGPEGM